MSRQRRLDIRWYAALAGGALALAILLAALGAVWAGAVTDTATWWFSLAMTWGFGVAAWGFGLKGLFDRWVVPAQQLLEQTLVCLRTDVVQPLTPKGTAELRAITELINALVGQREQLRTDLDRRIQEASERVAQEKNRLAALMSELTQSVVVCNLDGRVLLYNSRARMQFRALSPGPKLADGTELLGLGRSIYAVFDRQLVAHALENVQTRMRRGAAHPVAQFVTTTASGQLLRVHMAPVRAADDGVDLTGFVLMLENITREYDDAARQAKLFTDLSDANLSSLTLAMDAVSRMTAPGATPDRIAQQADAALSAMSAMRARWQTATAEHETLQLTRWPLEEMLGADLTSAMQRRVQDTVSVPVSADEVDASLWLKVESYSLMLAVTYLASRLVDEFDVNQLMLRLTPSDRHPDRAHLDLVWRDQVMSTETVMSWEMDSIHLPHVSTHMSVKDVVERHGGLFGFERERTRHEACFRLVLPVAAPQEAMAATDVVKQASRPEYYDFDLFQTTDEAQKLEDVPLTQLVYTVFDTETTGLNPSQGDEIIQIGATRIVNGKLLRHESFEQLVDPQRRIPAASMPIHGITPDMVAGQPVIAEVLRTFQAFALDTVLVAHNAAFDMRFLQIQEKKTGLVFDHPVLDTLLLSAVIHPNQDSHRLEAIAERFGVTVLGRHTAMGDAMVTAEVFLKMIPLLADKGIVTLGQAREAAQKTYYARLKY